MGFLQSHYGYNLLTKRSGGELVMILIYVDDLLLTGNSKELVNQAREDLQKSFKIKDLGELKFFLGIEVARSKKGIVLCQRKYALELIQEAGLSGAKPGGTPLELSQKLTCVEYDQCIPNEAADSDEALRDASAHQRLVGRLLYLTMTSLDLAFSVQMLSQFMHSPKVSHMEATLRAARYVKGNPGLGLFMPAEHSDQLVAYYDSDWEHACRLKDL
ncbi:uncharacterized mitochondrial protein AtMg00810-like [Lycium ferocissimum]|uniref:uncharacterized mitochondrial protein AtMg00810-like n=1 Tax=Lycium ferocissimum TaxID=112874 RepID=UPI0028158297|nr:uncharacterized mitochondrial protein AtMg00810-like [Lycium ferocissimum]